MDTRPSRLSDLRLGVPDERFWSEQPLDTEVAEVARNGVERLKSAGVMVVEVDLREAIAVGRRLANIVPAGSRRRFREWLAEQLPGTSFETLVDQIASRDVRVMYRSEGPRPNPAMGLEQRRAARTAANTEFAAMLSRAGVDALAFPNPLILAPPIEPGGDPETPTVIIGGQPRPLAVVALPTMAFGSRLGAPGLTLPVGLARGLPVGMELTARPGEDSHLLAIGSAIEQALGPVPPPQIVGA